VQSGSFLTARSHRLNLYIVPRVLISELQAFSQGIHKTAMVRPDSPIDPNDVVLIRQMSCDSVFHGTHPINRRRDIERRPTVLGSVPDALSLN
jgi:hypothetical protein